MMREHPIEGLMSAAMNSIQDMVDVNTIIGDMVSSADGDIFKIETLYNERSAFICPILELSVITLSLVIPIFCFIISLTLSIIEVLMSKSICSGRIAR